jgi:hypothetical protein
MLWIIDLVFYGLHIFQLVFTFPHLWPRLRKFTFSNMCSFIWNKWKRECFVWMFCVPIMPQKCFYFYFSKSIWGVRSRVVKVVVFKPLVPHRCGFESRQGHWIISCEGSYPASLWNVRGSNQVPVHAWISILYGSQYTILFTFCYFYDKIFHIHRFYLLVTSIWHSLKPLL